MEVMKKAQSENKLMVFYLHDHTSTACQDVDIEVLIDEEVLKELGKFTVYGLSIHTDHGKLINKSIEAKAIPHISIIKIQPDGSPLILHAFEGKDDIVKDSLIDKLQTFECEWLEELSSHLAL